MAGSTSCAADVDDAVMIKDADTQQQPESVAERYGRTDEYLGRAMPILEHGFAVISPLAPMNSSR